MTTLVVVAVDDFALRVESDDPDVPPWLLQCAERVQEEARVNYRKAIEEMMYSGTSVHLSRLL